uniref:Uncharacterized protein n=1 Tax=Romanomermis culicivorax TaxID=13658 RepID=A0A915KGI2_ROMCU
MYKIEPTFLLSLHLPFQTRRSRNSATEVLLIVADSDYFTKKLCSYKEACTKIKNGVLKCNQTNLNVVGSHFFALFAHENIVNVDL